MANMDVYLPFDTGPGANVTEDGWRKMMRHINGSASGAVRGFQNDMLVYADSTGMQVKVKTGECLMRGHYGSNDTEKILPIAASHATLARLDRVIIRADFLNNVISLQVLTGTAASTPVAPAVTQSSTIWETSLATVSVAATSVTVAVAAVTDDRVFTTANAKYVRRGAAPVFSLATNAFTRLTFTDIDFRSGDVTHNAAASEFTLKRAGLWTISARAQFVANATGGRQIHILDPADLTTSVNASLVYGAQTGNGAAGMNSILSCTATERFLAGKVISMVGWQNSGSSLDIHPIEITFTWIGP